MKLIITTNDGEIIAHWDIEKDFGNINKSLPQQVMLMEIIDRLKKQENKI